MKKQNRVERWRRESGLKQRDVAEMIGATDYVVVQAEAGNPIRAEFIEAFLTASGGFLRRSDFQEARHWKQKEQGNGETRNRRRQKAGRPAD